jgi:hypothetical protein
MKKALLILISSTIILACSNNPGESGTVNDGYKGASDANGALPNSDSFNATPAIDTSIKGNNRVDTERRDSTWQ